MEELEKGKHYLVKIKPRDNKTTESGYLEEIEAISVSKKAYNIHKVGTYGSGSQNWILKEKWHELYNIVEKLEDTEITKTEN